MGSGAEGDMLAGSRAVESELVGLADTALVAVRGRDAVEDTVALRDRDAVDVDFLGAGSREELDRGIEAQRLFDRISERARDPRAARRALGSSARR